ncbi:MAG: hypothetical protein ACP5KW_12375, partial [Thermoproteota archaeon]
MPAPMTGIWKYVKVVGGGVATPTLQVLDYFVSYPRGLSDPTAGVPFNVTIKVKYDGPGSLRLNFTSLMIETHPEKDMNNNPFRCSCGLIEINGKPYKEPVIPSGEVTDLTYACKVDHWTYAAPPTLPEVLTSGAIDVVKDVAVGKVVEVAKGLKPVLSSYEKVRSLVSNALLRYMGDFLIKKGYIYK